MDEVPAQNSKPEVLRVITQKIDDVTQLLRTQRDLLRQRGMNLPSGSLDNLRTLKGQIDELSRTMIDNLVELRSLRALAETSALVNSSLSTEDVLNQVMDTVIALTRAERGYIALRNKHTGDLEFRIARGMDQAQLDNSKGLIVSKTIVNDVAQSGEAILTDNASADKRYNASESIAGYNLRSIVAVPLKVRDEVIGVAYCDNRFMPGVFRAQEMDVLTAFANQAAVAIENAQLFEASRIRLGEVTEIRDRMRNLFTSIANGVITVDKENRVLIVNTAMHHILGVSGDVALAGENLDDVLPLMPEHFTERLLQVHEEGSQHRIELTVTMPNTGIRHWTVALSPLRDEGNPNAGVTIVVSDMTEQKMLTSQLAEVKLFLPSALFEHFRDASTIDMQGQEREITAMFADVRGFTTFSENLEPEDLMRVINKYLSLASDAIGLFEGITDKYLGDAVTGLWNTQFNPQEDHVVRAVSAALQLRLDLMAQHEVLPEDERLFYGIGVHTGPAVIGNVGSQDRKELAALGEAHDIAKYLQEQAGEGEIIISQAVYDEVEDVFECAPVEARRPKPGYEDVAMYRVVKRKKATGSLFIDDELRDLLGDIS
ncbi:GAF domain-containing protein [Phototrophicus methaneseepsis]|uniref:GAF domain-containing protein n=1 Tax=Phototrophicus methaneseepsis TaxID=2710758 RepID=A0A7S8ECM8_9CHLR|nr:adenylate/guanylate cyclase domain-containing protein [Phototrophicus methaneseepsis]QPC84501.1 GAF domain-containing protein [Phototrophicus methaneseepsis]